MKNCREGQRSDRYQITRNLGRGLARQPAGPLALSTRTKPAVPALQAGLGKLLGLWPDFTRQILRWQ